MTEQRRKKYIAFMTLRDELLEEEQTGYQLTINGREATAEEIARICVFEEETSYMRDYSGNRSKRSAVINFDPVDL